MELVVCTLANQGVGMLTGRMSFNQPVCISRREVCPACWVEDPPGLEHCSLQNMCCTYLPLLRQMSC